MECNRMKRVSDKQDEGRDVQWTRFQLIETGKERFRA
jgi:hypothetical protein